MKLSRVINARFILMVIMLLGFWLKSSAELPFKNAQEFTDYVRNLDLDKLEPIKSVDELLDPVGKEPTDPVLTKGIKLFNDGKIEDAIKYFQKITKKRKKYSQWQRQYAEYQLFHIENFGMLDPLYNGRPTTLDRSGGTIYGEYILAYGGWYIETDKLILSAIYPNVQSPSWKYLADSKSYYDRYKEHLKDKIDLDELHVLLKASFGNDSKEWLKNFPNGVKIQGYYNYMWKEFPKKRGPFKSVDDYVSTTKQLPKSPRIRKALELARRGDDKKAYKLFKKIGGDYADYQQWHLINFNKTDPYYDGRPSKIYRWRAKPEKYIDEPKEYGKDYVIEDDQTYITIYALQDSSINLLKDYFYWVKPGKSDSSDDIVISKDELDIFDMLINRAFPVGGDDDVVSRSLQFKMEHAYEGNNLENDLYRFQNNMNFIPLLQRMKISKSNNFGIGMSADELYSEAMKILPPLPELKLDKRYKWKGREKLNDKGMTYLLRSAFWGNPKALNAFIIYNAMYINSRHSFFNDYSALDGISETQKKLMETLCEMSLLDKPELKPTLYAYKKLFDESYAYHHANYQKEMNRLEKLEQQRREEKAKMWLGIANTLIQGAQQIANIYAQSSTMKQHQAKQTKQTKQTKQKGGSGTSLASYLEDPNHFDRDLRMLMQAADQMTRQKDWNDYCTMRAMMQQLGVDLSYEDYKLTEGMALMELKNQGIDIVAEQQARNKEMRDFYRSQMNSGKENVERIKEQNRMKYGGGSSSTTSSSTSTTSSRSSATNSPRSSAPKTPSQTSTTPKQQNSQANNDAHQQYKSGNLNVQESSYGEKIKNVSLWIKDGANYRSASLSGELYRKEGQFFVKIGGTFFRVGSIGGAYNSYIMYGMKAYYFNR